MATFVAFLWLLLLCLHLSFVFAASSDNGSSNLSKMEDPTESTRLFYNEHVEDYIANINKAGITHVPASHSKSFIRYMKQYRMAESTFKVLELGCGYGRDAELFSNLGMNVIATDFSRSMLLRALERAPRAHFLELDMRLLGKYFLPNSVDGIWACATVIHIKKSDIPELCKTMFDILRPGGIVYVSVKQGSGETFHGDVRYGGIKKFYAFYTQEELLDYFTKAGFEIEESGVADHRSKDSYATHPFIHVFAKKTY